MNTTLTEKKIGNCILKRKTTFNIFQNTLRRQKNLISKLLMHFHNKVPFDDTP